jgi:RsiW-degrading membrane proteinase PrsW (M82 family)
VTLDRKIARLAWGGRTGDPSALFGLGAVLARVALASARTLFDWFSTNALPMVAGMAVAAVIYLPTVFVLWFLDRRARTPWPVVAFVMLATWLFFAPLAGAANDWLGRFLPLFAFVGLVEEACKIAPLLIILIILIFLPRAVSGARDGLILGALGGLGFAIIEFGYYVAHVGFDDVGWKSLPDQIARGNFLGTHNHVISSATLGAAFGRAANMPRGWRRIALPLGAYVVVAMVHDLQDGGGNVIAVMFAGMLLEPVLLAFPEPETVMNDNMTLIQLYFGTVNLLLINCFLLPILWLVVRRSGDTERKIIRERLQGEAPDVISRAELDDVNADRRYKRRKLRELSAATSRRLVQLQNELALHKEYITRTRTDIDSDPPVKAVRGVIASLRKGRRKPT